MSVFNYVAVNEKGKTRKGILEGDSSSQIRHALMNQGLTPIEINPAQEKTVSVAADTTSSTPAAWKKIFTRKKGVPISHLAIVTYQFSTLLTAGLPVEAALSNMAAEMENQTLKRALMGVRNKLLEGHSLATGMREYPSIFPNLYVASVAVGEKTGQLDRVLTRLADYYEKQRAVRDKIFHAMIYPLLLTLVAAGIVIFLLVYVIPQVTTVFIETGQELPGITTFLLSVSAGLQAYGIYILAVLIGGFIAFRIALRNVKFRYKYQKFLLGLPLIGPAIISINASRFSRTFGILFAAGVPVIDAMTSSNSIITLIPMNDALKTAIIKVSEGTSIHLALQNTGYFSSLSNQLIASGEQSGNLEAMLEKAANFQEQATSSKVSTVLALFEPVLILSMGGIVLFIVLAVLLPIFQMNQLVQ